MPNANFGQLPSWSGTIPYGRLAAAFGSGNSTGAVRWTRPVSDVLIEPIVLLLRMK